MGDRRPRTTRGSDADGPRLVPPRTEPDAAPGLYALPANGALVRIAPGETVTVGREADVVLADDVFLHGTAYVLDVGETHWSVRLPARVRLEVTVYSGTERVWTGGPGATWTGDIDAATILVRTVEAVHALEVWWTASAAGHTLEPEPTFTAPADSLIDVDNANHRALIVACSARLTDASADALSAARVARILGITQDAALQRLKRAVRDLDPLILEVQNRDTWRGPDALRFTQGKLDRNAAVAWLVGTGVVRPADVNYAISVEESKPQRDRAEEGAG